MAAPTFVASYIAGTNFTGSTSPSATASVNRLTNDRLVAVGLMEDTGNGANSINATDNTGVAWTRAQEIIVASRCYATLWIATASSDANTTLSFAEGTSTAFHWGVRVFHFRDSDGFGVSNKGDAADTAPSVTLTGVSADSAIVVCLADWEAGGATITWRTADAGAMTQTDGFDDGALYSGWTGYHANAGSAGNKVVGATVPAAPDWSLCAAEVKGTAAAAATSLIVPSRFRRSFPALLDV